MKLYVRESVLCDYTCGIAFAVAESKKAAREQIAKELNCPWSKFQEIHSEFFDEQPQVHELTTPVAYTCYGGG